MLIDYKGPIIGVVVNASESESHNINITLADGYTIAPILVTGDDGNEYNVIPSDQLKWG